jgi:hypothetical protein
VKDDFPVVLTPNVHFGVIDRRGSMAALVSPEGLSEYIVQIGWNGRLEELPPSISKAGNELDRGIRFRDVDNDGECELLIANDRNREIYHFTINGLKRLTFAPPALVDARGLDTGVRFVDLNRDHRADFVRSNNKGWAIALFKDVVSGWEILHSGDRGATDAIPMITRDGTNNGAWFHSRHLWVQNEDTAKMKDLVDRRSFEELLQKK